MSNPTSNWVITVVPAYGRDYQTSDEAFAAWMADKDFHICTPGYHSFINKADAERFGVPENTVRIRFKGATELFTANFDPATKRWTKGASTDDETLEEINDEE